MFSNKSKIQEINSYDVVPMDTSDDYNEYYDIEYYDIEENFKFKNDVLIDIFYNVDLVYLKNKIENEYNDAIIHYFESANYLSIRNKQKCIFSIYDPHS